MPAPSSPMTIPFPKKIVYKYKERCQPEDIRAGYFVDIVSIGNMIPVSTTPELSIHDEGTSFLVLNAGTKLDVTTGHNHWYLSLVSKHGYVFDLTSRNPIGVDNAEIFRAAVPLPLP